jgi:hypothetical protein
LREAVVQAAVHDDSVYRSWHDRYVASLSSLHLPDEFEATARLNQQRFGTPYNPMRGVQAPNQVDLLGLMRALVELGRKLGGK